MLKNHNNSKSTVDCTGGNVSLVRYEGNIIGAEHWSEIISHLQK